MKTRFFTYWLILCLLPILSSCEKEEEGDLIWDFSTRSIMLKVVNASGQNMLNESTANGWKAEDISATYKDESYPCTIVDEPLYQPQSDIPTRYLPAFMRGLRTSTEKQNRILYFGDFTPTNNYKDTPITYHWPDGTTTTITFDFYITWKSKNDPVVTFKCYLNGKELPQDKGVITIQK